MGAVMYDFMELQAQRRRDQAFATALSTAIAHYYETPGLRLTTAQAARLWDISVDVCGAVLDTLVARRFLSRTASAHYVRISVASS
jgi:chromosome condensin MukBEF complex kleisin-like MukF subunit